MVRSMTGYGTSCAQREQRAVAVEIRSTNHRFLDLSIRLPREYAFLEPELAQLLRAALHRGRVELHAAVQAPVPPESLLDLEVAGSYAEAAARLRERFRLDDTLDLRTLLLLPGVVRGRDALRGPDGSADPVAPRLVLECAQAALTSLVAMRAREGCALAQAMGHSLERVRAALAELRSLLPLGVDKHRRKLTERMDRLLPDLAVDPQRLAQEVALLAERCDIGEELDRLESHASQCGRLLASQAPIGKELDFLMQEMQREINTTLAKSADLEITRPALAMKIEIERLREQAQNIE